MSARLIDGLAIAAGVEARLRERIHTLHAAGIQPGLAAVRVGDDPASEIYVRNKGRKAQALGIHAVEVHLPEQITQDSLLQEIRRLNADDSIDGILLQLPLPRHLDARKAIESIDPSKDVDGFHPANVGLLHLGRPGFVPCTPAGIIELIETTGTSIAGSRAVIIGRSHIVGRPVAALLLERDATATICHSKSQDLGSIVAEAGIVVAAVGRPHFVTAGMVRPGAVVIDVGINRLTDGQETRRLLAGQDDRIASLEKRGSVVVGDVDFARVREVAGWITPVPGGVGPMTIIMLMSNTVTAATRRRS